ncbi:MAG: MTH1187 family thiamine-binding protein [Defluviitaleaceae bacterium]|nr:MTH1187 family thiamine-binding protein [Defluviitaleaceae bacterium]
MNTLIAVSIAPFGVGDKLSEYVAQVVKVIEASGLPSRTTSMFTEIEGEWDEVMQVVKDATFVLAEKGIRTNVTLKADIRPGYTNRMKGKIEKLDSILGGKRG